MACPLCFLLCFVIFAPNLLFSQALDSQQSSDVQVLSVQEYSTILYPKYLAHMQDVFQCNFDKGFCGFQRANADFDWALMSFSTPSALTGPSDDLTGQGLYVYIETSAPQKEGNKALLVTPVLPPMVYCLQFGYHAYGDSIGGLFVYMKDVLKDERRLLVKSKKNYGKKWQYITTTVVNTERLQIMFEGVRGSGYRGDIAIDNVRITEGRCPEINKTDICGIGYTDLSSKLDRFPPSITWPWLVGLSPRGKTHISCSAVYVSRDSLLASKDCVEKFAGETVTTYSEIKESSSRVVEKIQKYPSKTFEGVLLHLRKTAAKRKADRVCLPPSTQRGIARHNCYLLAAEANLFYESPVTIVPLGKCVVPLDVKERRNLLCVQTTSHYGEDQTSVRYDGYIICKNKLLHLWILHAVGSFARTNNKTLLFTKLSTVVDWIEKSINITVAAPKPPVTPPIPQELSKGIQIFEQTIQKCLAYVAKTKTFAYEACNIYRTSQRFLLNDRRQIVSLEANMCLSTTNRRNPSFVLRVTTCNTRQKSRQWTCVGRMLVNDYFTRRYVSFKKRQDMVILNEDKDRGHFVVYNTKESICSVLKTVKGELNCDKHPHSLCGFTIGDQHYAQYKWVKEKRGRRPASFKTEWRGRSGFVASAEMRSPMFNDQRCLKFQSYLFGHPRDALVVYKKEEKRRRELVRVSPGKKPYFWRSHAITVTPQLCNSYEIFFLAALGSRGEGKFRLRGIRISPGSCEPPRKKLVMSSPPARRNTTQDVQCLKGWTYLNGSCYYFYNLTTSWYQASTVCQITEAKLATANDVTGVTPRESSAWFGVRSCPNGDFQTVKHRAYSNGNIFSAKGQCLQIQTSTTTPAVFKSSSCAMKLPFACQKDPLKTKNGCGLRNRTASADRQWPWHVVLVMFKRCVCAGTLVAPGYVVTSSQCVNRIQLKNLKIFIPSSRTIIHNVTKIIIHPDPVDYDIAIVMFEHSILSSPSPPFACVNKMTDIWKERKSSKSELLNGTTCYVLGWGTQKGGKRTCGPQNYGVYEVEIIDKKRCGRFFGHYMMKEGIICAYAKKRTWRNCLGDTGGPLVCDIAGAWTLVGITRYGADCTDTRRIGIYTDVASTVSWLEIFS